MLTIYRSNRIEWLADILAAKYKLKPPKIFDSIEIVVNTWPTSRWLTEYFAVSNGISSLVRFPFPGSYLRKIARSVLGVNTTSEDPWNAKRLVWIILEILPSFLETKEADLLKGWLSKNRSISGKLGFEQWQLARSIADAFDDYALYRPELIMNWSRNGDQQNLFDQLPDSISWQPPLMKILCEKIDVDPFCLQVHKAIELLRVGSVCVDDLPATLCFFGISSLAPIQVEFIQALSGILDVQMFLLTPCPDLWQRCRSRRETLGKLWTSPFDGDWLMQSPRLEAILGRMGAEFQQIVEGSGEVQFGVSKTEDLFAAPVTIASQSGLEPTLLEQLQQTLVSRDSTVQLDRKAKDDSLIFFSCPGKLREVQLIRDQILQWFAADNSLEPRDVLIMTPQVSTYAPILSSVFNDKGATGVEIPWRITDRSQSESSGLIKGMIELLGLSGERITASSLEDFLGNPALQEHLRLDQEEIRSITNALQMTGFRWGLDAEDRGGNEINSLKWCLDRWLLGLVFSSDSGVVLNRTAPFSEGMDTSQVDKWWHLLSQIRTKIKDLRVARRCQEWVLILKDTLDQLFGSNGIWAWEYQCFQVALDDWLNSAVDSTLLIEPTVVKSVLEELLSVESGRFGHRSGALTISALEPMRAIPHRVIVLMGLDSKVFPRSGNRPSFHLLEYKRLLGDPVSSDQDRYVLLEALMSSRQHLLLSWNGRDVRTGESLPASTPVQQLLGYIQQELRNDSFDGLLRDHSPNPLDHSNFVSLGAFPPGSCDRRHLEARILLDKGTASKRIALALPSTWKETNSSLSSVASIDLLQRWLVSPQIVWLEEMQLKPKEWFDHVLDRDSLSLQEWERQQIIRKSFMELDELGIINSIKSNDYNSVLSKWNNYFLGQGKLPFGAAGELEMNRLVTRWKNLINLISQSGSVSLRNVEYGEWNNSMLYTGNDLIILNSGKANFKSIIQAWFIHLLACRVDSDLNSTCLISLCSSRIKKDNFEITHRFRPLDVNQASEIIHKIRELYNRGVISCWPIPPESTWSYVCAEKRSLGKGSLEFSKHWTGGLSKRGERTKPEMELCFGIECPPEKFLGTSLFYELTELIYSEVLDNML